MTTFPGSPRVLKGALVAINLPDPTLNVITFQYNPVTLTRSLQGQTVNEGERASGPVRLTGAPQETITLSEVEIDATDQNKPSGNLSILPQLAALELLLYPRSSHVLNNIAQLALGTIEIIPPARPFTIFIFGQQRILPVQLTSFSITEQAFDPNLNPIRATVSLSLQVLSYNELLPEHPGHAVFMAHQISKEFMASDAVVHNLDGVTGNNTNLF